MRYNSSIYRCTKLGEKANLFLVLITTLIINIFITLPLGYQHNTLDATSLKTLLGKPGGTKP